MVLLFAISHSRDRQHWVRWSAQGCHRKIKFGANCRPDFQRLSAPALKLWTACLILTVKQFRVVLLLWNALLHGFWILARPDPNIKKSTHCSGLSFRIHTVTSASQHNSRFDGLALTSVAKGRKKWIEIMSNLFLTQLLTLRICQPSIDGCFPLVSVKISPMLVPCPQLKYIFELTPSDLARSRFWDTVLRDRVRAMPTLSVYLLQSRFRCLFHGVLNVFVQDTRVRGFRCKLRPSNHNSGSRLFRHASDFSSFYVHSVGSGLKSCTAW